MLGAIATSCKSIFTWLFSTICYKVGRGTMLSNNFLSDSNTSSFESSARHTQVLMYQQKGYNINASSRIQGLVTDTKGLEALPFDPYKSKLFCCMETQGTFLPWNDFLKMQWQYVMKWEHICPVKLKQSVSPNYCKLKRISILEEWKALRAYVMISQLFITNWQVMHCKIYATTWKVLGKFTIYKPQKQFRCCNNFAGSAKGQGFWTGNVLAVFLT